jgi:glycosyltransferase involved in cell wall biosynthesis
MKIFLLHAIFRPERRGGAEVVVQRIVDGLVDLGHEVSVIAVGRTNQTEREEKMVIHRIKSWNIFNFLDLGMKPMWQRLIWHCLDITNDVQAWRIYKILKKEKPDLVLTHNLKGLGYVVPRLLVYLNIKHIHTVHDQQLLHPSGLSGEKLSLVATIYMWLCRWLFASPQVVVFPSQAILSRYEKYRFFPRSQKIVLGNPLPYPVPELVKPQSREKYSVLYLGQIEKYKGVFDLIEGVRNIKSEKLQLHIVGDGSALQDAKNIAEGDARIIFHGRAPSQQWLQENIWPTIDLLVLPSHAWESFGMVVIEAFAHGVPVLVSKNGALPELVEEGRTGWILDSITSELIASKVTWIMDGACRLESMRMLCHARAKDFELDSYLKRLLESVTIDTH